MGKYTSYKSREKAPGPKRNEVHPVMRGIGCIMLAIVPLLSYGIAVLLVNYGIGRWPIPNNWLGTPKIPSLLLKLQGLRPVYDFIYLQTNLIANLVFAVAVAVLIFGLLSVLYGFIYKIAGPSQYGPTDEPPIRKKVKEYKR